MWPDLLPWPFSGQPLGHSLSGAWQWRLKLAVKRPQTIPSEAFPANPLIWTPGKRGGARTGDKSSWSEYKAMAAGKMRGRRDSS